MADWRHKSVLAGRKKRFGLTAHSSSRLT